MEDERLTVRDTSVILGISEGAVRKRIARGSLRHERDDQGQVWVLLDVATRGRTRAGHEQDAGMPGGQDAGKSQQDADEMRDELVDELRDRISYLERQVEEEREARRRADTLMARFLERVPAIEAPREATSREDTGQVTGQDVGDTRVPVGQDTGVEAAIPEETASRLSRQPVRSSWWRRFFGFE